MDESKRNCSEDDLKVSKLLVGGVLLCLAVLVIVMPAANVGEQDATATPEIVIITATPSDNSQAGGDTSATEASTSAPTAAATTDANSTDPVRKATRAMEGFMGKLEGSPNKYLGQAILKAYKWQVTTAKSCMPNDKKVSVSKDLFGWVFNVDTYQKHYDFFVSFDLT